MDTLRIHESSATTERKTQEKNRPSVRMKPVHKNNLRIMTQILIQISNILEEIKHLKKKQRTSTHKNRILRYK